MKQVDLYANGALLRARRRCTRSSSATRRRPRPSATTVTLTAEADRRGRQHGDLGHAATSTWSPRRRSSQSPVPVDNPTLTGTPTVGSTLTCINGGFLNAPRVRSRGAWLRNGARDRRRPTGDRPTSPTTADVGRGGRPAAMSAHQRRPARGDATSEALDRLAGARLPAHRPAGARAPVACAAAGPAGDDAGAKADARRSRRPASWPRTASRSPAPYHASPPTASSDQAQRHGPPAGHQEGVHTKTGKGKVKMTLRSTKRLKKAPKVVAQGQERQDHQAITVTASRPA